MGYIGMDIIQDREFSAKFYVREDNGYMVKDLSLFQSGSFVFLRRSDNVEVFATNLVVNTQEEGLHFVTLTLSPAQIDYLPPTYKLEDDEYIPESPYYGVMTIQLQGEPPVLSHINRIKIIKSADAPPPSREVQITSVTVPSSAIFKAGDILEFRLYMEENIQVSGNPFLTLKIGDRNKYADYYAHGANYAVFRYTVENNLLDEDGITLYTNIDTTNGFIKGVSGDFVETTFTAPNTSGIKVDSMPVAGSVYCTHVVSVDGTYSENDQIFFELHYNGVVEYGGANHSLPVKIDGTYYRAVVRSGNLTNIIRWGLYLGTSNYPDVNSISVNGSVDPGGSLYTALNGTLDLSVPSTIFNNIRIRMDGYVFNSITPPLSATYRNGDILTLKLESNDNAIIGNNAFVSMYFGTPTSYRILPASYHSGSGTKALIFNYKVESNIVGNVFKIDTRYGGIVNSNDNTQFTRDSPYLADYINTSGIHIDGS